MAQKKQSVNLSELRGNDRVFQIDRDTVIIFSGRDRRDIRPFVRIGSGAAIPHNLLRHIENVILPDSDPPNAALEVAWIQATIEDGNDVIRYVGSKDTISQMYYYSGIGDMREDKKPHVELIPYTQGKGVQDARGRSTTTLYGNGNFSVTVGGSKVMDFQSFRRMILTVDKEHEILCAAASKRAQRCTEKVSFLVPTGSENEGLPMFWNFAGQGALVNPPVDPHYRLFENAIDPNRVTMAISDSPYRPGLVELIRRRNATKSPFGVSAPGGDRLNNLKKLYQQTKLAFFEDARSLPYAKETTYFASRTRSHGVFVIRMGGSVESHVQILFPLSEGARKNKTFEYVRGPYDVEIAQVADKKDFEDVQGRLVLHLPHGISEGYYLGRSLRPGSYPLSRAAQYNVHYGEKPAGLVPVFLKALKGTAFEAPVQDFLMQCLGVEADPTKATALIAQMQAVETGKDLALRNNVREFLRFVSEMPEAAAALQPEHKKAIEKLYKKNSTARFTNRQWIALGQSSAYSFEILNLAGKRTYLLAQSKEPEVVAFQVPPAIEHLEAYAGAYKSLLRKQSRMLDKANDPPGYRGCLEAVEKILEERFRLLHERQRLYDLLGALDIGLHAPRKASLGLKEKVVAWIGNSRTGVKRGIQFVRDSLMLMTDRVKSVKAAAVLVVAGIAVVLATAGLVSGARALAGTFGRGPNQGQAAGNRGPALETAVLARPGEIQEGYLCHG